jgi:hypothetical protein
MKWQAILLGVKEVLVLHTLSLLTEITEVEEEICASL